MEDTIITTYYLCEEFLEAIGHHDDPQVRLSTAEVMSVALVAAAFFGGNVEATPFGGLFAMHRLVTRLGLAKAIDDNLELLKIHLPYHESDHVLTLAYSVLCGGTRLEDVDRLRNDGDDCGRMMSIGLHPRITGNPARSDALARFIAYAQKFDDVAFMRRLDIARSFAAQVPKP